MSESEFDARWWMVGILREGAAHLGVAVVIWLILWQVVGTDPASIGTAMFFVGRELRDWEIEALPGLMHALGFKGWNGLRPCTSWDLAQLRHSLSGWVPVCLACAVLWWVL